MKIPRWLKLGAGALGLAALLGSAGMYYDGAPAPHAAHAHVAMYYDGAGAGPNMYYD